MHVADTRKSDNWTVGAVKMLKQKDKLPTPAHIDDMGISLQIQ